MKYYNKLYDKLSLLYVRLHWLGDPSFVTNSDVYQRPMIPKTKKKEFRSILGEFYDNYHGFECEFYLRNRFIQKR